MRNYWRDGERRMEGGKYGVETEGRRKQCREGGKSGGIKGGNDGEKDDRDVGEG